jgi:hypothetical protein
MILAGLILWNLSVKRFHSLSGTHLRQADAVRAMEAGAVA